MIEIWKPIPDWEEWYEVSDQGRVRSWHGPSPHLLKNKSRTDGYLQVRLCLSPTYKAMLVHRLVTQAFIGPAPEGMEVCHNNGIRYDNRLINLRYGTRSDNQGDRIVHGTTNRGERSPQHRLNQEQVIEIRSRYSSGGILLKDLAKEYGVQPAQIGRIVRKASWGWLPC